MIHIFNFQLSTSSSLVVMAMAASGDGLLADIFGAMVVSSIVTHFVSISTKSNGTKTWQCLSCKKSMTVMGEAKLKYHVAQVEGGGVSVCRNPHPAMRDRFRKELSDKKRAAEDVTSESCSSSGPGALENAFGGSARLEADESIVNWLAFSKLPPNVTSSSFFKVMLQKTRAAGVSYGPPSRESMGMDRGKIGSVLQLALDHAREKTARALKAVHLYKVS
jgi:hypothetical protein